MYTIMGDSIIIDGFLWTPLDTCHALLTVCTKHDFLVMYGNILVWSDILEEPVPFMDKLDKALSLCTGEIHFSINEYFSEQALEDKVFLTLLSDGLTAVQSEMYEAFIDYGKREGVIDKAIPNTVLMKFILAFNQIPLSSTNYREEVEMLHHLFLHGILG